MRFAFEHPSSTVLVRADRPTGEWALTLRETSSGERIYGLVLNGRLLMDSAEGSSEAALAEVGLRRCADGTRLRVLVGGLGFGFTLGAVLRDPRVARVDVVELEPALISFLASPGMRAELGAPDLRDPRVAMHVGDVRERIAARGDRYDAILLDVDNGPEALSAVGNADLYTDAGLRASLRALRRGGALAIWSSEPARECLARMRAVFGDADELLVPVERGGRHLDLRILVAVRPGGGA